METRNILFPSEKLGRQIPLRILLPPGEHRKCLLLLHGYNGSQNQWTEKSDIASLCAQYGLAVVMPGCGNGYYEATREDMPGFLGEELPAFLRKTMPISAGREDFSVAGVSMGGFGALLVGAKYPETFGKIASLSGAFILPDVVIGNPGVLGNADPDYFRSVFGAFETLEGSERDPVAEAVRAAEKGRLGRVYLLCGTGDVLFRGNEKTALALEKAGADLLWRSAPGGHEWAFWNRELPRILQWLVQ